jgi:transposase
VLSIKDNGIDFEGQHFFIGTDVHKKQWTVSIRHNNLTLKTFSMDPYPEKLKGYLEKNFPNGIYHVVYEVGFCGFWICRVLREMGIDCIVVNPPDIPTAHKEKDRKADPIDASKLARELEKGELKCIYIPEEKDQHLRSLCRLYRKAVQDITRIKNRTKGHLHFNGVEMPRHSSYWSGRFIAYLKSITLDNGPAKDYLDLCLEELDHRRNLVVTILTKLRRYLQEYRDPCIFRNLLTVPGIGFKAAAVLYSEIIDINRFPTLDHIKSYAGLVPSTSSSGESQHTGGLTYRSNRYLKYVLIEAAWVAIRHDPALLHSFNKLSLRMKKQDAIVRIAVKLLNRIRYVWHNNCPYVASVVQ